MGWSTVKSTFSEAENIFLVIQMKERIYGAFSDAKIEIIKDRRYPFCSTADWSSGCFSSDFNYHNGNSFLFNINDL
jgi:hypothetical protein